MPNTAPPAGRTDVKSQRDRFLAFSFASADLLLEVDGDGTVVYALGAARTLAGADRSALEGRSWLELFSQADRATLVNTRLRAREGQRCGPFAVTMDEQLGGGKEAILTAIRMPGSPNLHVTVGFSNALMEGLAGHVRQHHEDYEMMDKDTFLYAAKEALDVARSLGQELDMTLLDVGDAQKSRRRLGEEVWTRFTDAVTKILGAHSIDGHAVAEIGDGRYSVIHNQTVTSEQLRTELETLAKQSDPQGEGLEIGSKTVSADIQSLSERETMKALVYTINEFERKGTAIDADSLNRHFKTYVTANAQKIHQFKTMIEQLNFDLYFQPIVNLHTGDVSHFELLTRFKEAGSTQEWVMFGEDVGMAADLDIAVCERAINYVLYKSAGRRTKFALNISGQSIQNEAFLKTLMTKLSLHEGLSSRLMFEITESTLITDLNIVNHYIQVMQKQGYKVCLDDFGAGSASIQYLQQLHVDYVKIDGAYTMKLLHSPRDAVLIKNVCQMCKELNMGVVAERVEEEAEVERLKNLGVDMGQGYYFSPPTPKPTYGSNDSSS